MNQDRLPQVTIVTPVYNLGRYLEPTIQSVLQQAYPNLQYIIIDGGSTDGSIEIIKRYEKHLSYWVSEPDRGYADALAKGFSRATGDILCWINSGDLLLPGALDAARLALVDNGVDMIFGDDLYINEDGRVIFYSWGYVKDLRSAMLYGGWTPLQDACFWRRDLYEHVGGINPSIKYAADFDLFLRMALNGRCQYVPLTFSAFRRHAGQKSIAGSDAYKKERITLRRAMLDGLPGIQLGKSLKCLWHGTSIRWRIHVSQRRWRRPDLVAQPVDKLHCRQYWPMEATSG